MSVKNIGREEVVEFKIRKIQKEVEAISCFLSSMWYFIKHPVRVSSIFVLALIGWNLYVDIQHFIEDRAAAIVKPKSREVSFGSDFSFIPYAYAEEKNIPLNLVRLKKDYAFLADTTISLWKIAGENTIVLWHKQKKEILELSDLPEFNFDREK